MASLSPRRKELLKQAGLEFIIDSTNIDEVLNQELTIEEQLKDLAIQKANPLLDKYPDDIIIGADTVVCFGNKVLGKPTSYNDAYEMLLSYSGKSQIVYTAVAILSKNKTFAFVSSSEVCFKNNSGDTIKKYLDLNEWQDKAGGYAIQGHGAVLVEKYNGDFDTIVGLPVKLLMKYLNEEFSVR